VETSYLMISAALRRRQRGGLQAAARLGKRKAVPVLESIVGSDELRVHIGQLLNQCAHASGTWASVPTIAREETEALRSKNLSFTQKAIGKKHIYRSRGVIQGLINNGRWVRNEAETTSQNHFLFNLSSSLCALLS
jgi:hypothetical protein